MAAPTCTDINQYFTNESGRYSVDVRDRTVATTPWQRFTKVGKFPQGMGTTINDLTIERVLDTGIMDAWTPTSQNNGSGIVNTGCVPSPTALTFGHTARSFSLESAAWMTPCVCLDDLKTPFAVQQQVGKTVNTLTDFTRMALDYRFRAGYASVSGSVSHIVSMRPNLPTATAINASLPPPTLTMNADTLDAFRLSLLRDGAADGALGMEGGVPVLGWITSAEASRDILRNNSDLRQDIRFAQPSQLVAPLGIERSYGGWYHIIDMYLPRYSYTAGNANPWTQVFPFVSASTTFGNIWNVNPDYAAAPYELQFFYHPNAMEVMVQQTGPDIPDAPFTDRPEYYTMEFIWLNIPNMTDNPLGKIGRWMAIGTNAIRALNPYLAYSVMTKRCVATATSGCTYS